MQKGFTILLLLTIVCHFGYAQSSVRISGVIRDEKGIGLPKGNVQLIISKDTLRTISGENGVFSFTMEEVGKIEIRVSMEGYQPFQKVYDLEMGKDAHNLSPIVLSIA